MAIEKNTADRGLKTTLKLIRKADRIIIRLFKPVLGITLFYIIVVKGIVPGLQQAYQWAKNGGQVRTVNIQIPAIDRMPVDIAAREIQHMVFKSGLEDIKPFLPLEVPTGIPGRSGISEKQILVDSAASVIFRLDTDYVPTSQDTAYLKKVTGYINMTPSSAIEFHRQQYVNAGREHAHSYKQIAVILDFGKYMTMQAEKYKKTAQPGNDDQKRLDLTLKLLEPYQEVLEQFQ